MGKNISKKNIIRIIIMMLILNLFTFKPTYADVMGAGNSFLEAGEGVRSKVNVDALGNTTEYVFGVLLAVGIVVSVGVAIVLGIQFMLSGVEQKAQIKEALIPFVVGCVVIFGAFTIWTVVVNLGNSFEKSNSTATRITCESCNEELSGKLYEAAAESGMCPKCGESVY